MGIAIPVRQFLASQRDVVKDQCPTEGVAWCWDRSRESPSRLKNSTSPALRFTGIGLAPRAARRARWLKKRAASAFSGQAIEAICFGDADHAAVFLIGVIDGDPGCQAGAGFHAQDKNYPDQACPARSGRLEIEPCSAPERFILKQRRENAVQALIQQIAPGERADGELRMQMRCIIRGYLASGSEFV